MSKSTVNRILKDAEALRKQRSSGTAQTNAGQRNAAAILQNAEMERQKRQNVAANLDYAREEMAKKFSRGEFTVQDLPATRRIMSGLYNDVNNKLNSQIENELHIINDQGREKDDPAVLRAQETLKGLETKKAETQKKLGEVQKPLYGSDAKNRFQPKINYSTETNDYIRRVQGLNAGLAERMTQKQDIPSVWNKQLANFQHMINTPESTDSEDYVKWLEEGRRIGQYGDREFNAMLRGVGQADPAKIYAGMDDSEKSSYFNLKDQDMLNWENAMKWLAEHPEGADASALREKRQHYHDELADRYYNEDEFWQDEREAAITRLGNLNGKWLSYTPEGERMPVNIMGRKGNYDTPEQMARMDELLYDAVMGQGAYQDEISGYEGSTFRDQHMRELNERISRAWDAYENENPYMEGSRNELFDILTGRDAAHDAERVNKLESERRYLQDRITELDGKLSYYDQRNKYLEGYKQWKTANDTADDTQYDKGVYNPNAYRFTLAEKGSNNVDDIYSFIIGGKERQSYIEATRNGWGDKPPAISKDYKGAMLLMPEEINIFKNLYEANKKDEASAFLDGLQFAINQRYLPYEEIQTREEARAFPILNSVFAQGANVVNTVLGAANAAGAALGAAEGKNAINSANDPASNYYAPYRYASTVQDEVASMLGPDAGKLYLNTMNTMRNVINGVLLTKMGIPAGALPTASLATFGTQIYQEKMYEHLQENRDFEKANALSILDTALEIGEELLPIETMFATSGANVFVRVIANMLAEGGEELAGATAGEVLRGMITGRYAWEKRKDEIFNEGGYTDKDGNWIEIGKGDAGLAEAHKQAMREWGEQIVENTVAGAFGGGLGATYGAALNYSENRKTGIQVNSKEGGFDTLLEAARGMDPESETKKIADDLYKKQQKGKNISNYQAGKLARIMYAESGERIQDIIKGAMTRQVEAELKEEGASPEYAEKAAPAIAEAVTTGRTPKKADIRVIAKEDAGLVLMESYLAGEKNAEDTIKAAGGEAAIKAREAVRDVLGEKPAKVGPNKGDTARLRQFAPIAKQDELDNATGPRHDNGLDAVVGGQIVTIKGRSGDNYIVVDENNNERTVSKNEVHAADESLGLVMEYADRNRHIIDDATFQEIAFGLKDNKDMDLDDYLAQSTQAYIEYLTGGEVQNSQLAETTLSSLKAHAARMNDVLHEKGLVKPGKQQKVTPGKGTVTYNGIKAGTDEWQAMVKKAGPIKARELQLVAEIGVRLGNQFEIVEREDLPDSFGWEDRETGKIYINLAAKSSEDSRRNRSVTTIMAHELTHWLKQNSPEMYKELAQFVYKGLRERNENIVDSVYKKIGNEQAAVDRTISIADALDEIVADACDQVLTNEQTIRQLENESPNLYQKIKTFVRNFIDTVMGYTRNSKGEVNTDTSAASRKIRELGKEFEDELTRKWLETRAEALGRQEGNPEEAEVQEGTGETRMSTREQEEEYKKAQEKYKGKSLYKDSGLYDYDFMVSLPNIQIARVQGNISKYLDEKNNIDTKLLRVDGLKNAEQYGTKLPKDQGVAVVNNYTGRIMRITGRTITHSVFNDKPAKAQGNARAGLQAGLLAKIAVPINGLVTTEPNVEGTYALAAPIERNGVITGVAIITAEIRSGNVIGLDVYDQAHAISTRKKSGASNGTNAPALTSTKQQAVSTSTSRSSEMSISDFINLVNETYPDILSESIISKLGNNNATGYYKDKKLFSTREAVNQGIKDLEKALEHPHVKFSMREPVEATKDGLVAVHNLHENSLMKVFRLGGFAFPSIAIVRSEMGHTKYGEISVVFGKETIDPHISRYNKVYGGDAWTPTHPSIEYKLDDKKLNKTMQKIKNMLPEMFRNKANLVDLYETNLAPNINRQKGEPNIAEAIGSEANKWLRIAYMQDTGREIIYPTKQEDLDTRRGYSNEQVINMANILGQDLIADAMSEHDPWSWAIKHPEVVEQIRNELNEEWRKQFKKAGNSKLAKLDMYQKDSFGPANAEYMLRAADRYFKNGIRDTVDIDALDKTLKETIDKEDFNKWVNNLFSGLIVKRGIRNNKDYYTNTGNPRSWDQLHDEETLENVVKIMRGQEDKGENAFFGQSAIKARGTKDFKSIEEIRKSKDQLQQLSDEEYSEKIQAIGAQFSELQDELYSRSERNIFTARDRVIDAIADAVNISNKTASNISKRMKEWGYNLTPEQAQKIERLMKDISEMPTTYFEAKPKRAVGFDEVKRVILPATASQELFDAMNERGIPYDTYDGTDEDRLAKLNSVENVKFSTREMDSQYMRAVNSRDRATEQLMVDAQAIKSGFTTEDAFHGTAAFGFNSFDMEASGGAIFVAFSPKIAGTYVDNGEVRMIGKKYQDIGLDIMSAEQLAEELQEYYRNLPKTYGYETANEWTVKGIDKDDYVDFVYDYAENMKKLAAGKSFEKELSKLVDKMVALAHTGDEKAAYQVGVDLQRKFKTADYFGQDELENRRLELSAMMIPALAKGEDVININMHGMNYYLSRSDVIRQLEKYSQDQEGIYRFYTRPGNQLLIDAKGANWNKIWIEDEQLRNEMWTYFNQKEALEEAQGINTYSKDMFTVTTRQISEYARYKKYSSVRINDVYDHGGRGDWDRERGHGDIAMFFNPNDVKSADPVTYDDNGKVVPLHKRFTENDDLRFSTREADLEVNRWMLGLSESSLRTEQERMLWKQYKEVNGSWELTKRFIRELNDRLKGLEAKENKTAKDTFDIQNLQKQIEKWEKKRDEYEEQILKVTADEGYAAIMYRERNIMENLLNGRTEDEARQTIDAIQAELDTVAQEMAKRNERLKELAEKENVKIIRNQLNSAGLRRIAAKLKADLGSELQNKEIENRLALLALKMKQGKVDSSEIMELADMLVGSMRPAYDDYVLSELRGMTIALNDAEIKELKNRGMTVRDLQRELTGTGIRVTAGGPNTIDKNWDELTATFPQLDREANPGNMLYGPDADHKGLMDLVEDAIRQQKAMGPDSDQVAAMVLEAVSDLVPEVLTDEKSMKLIRESMEFIAEINQGTEALDNINALFDRLKKKNAHAKATLGTLENKIVDAIEYTNELAKQHDVTAWKRERQALVERLRSEHTQKLLEEQTKYREKIERYKKAQELTADNQAARREIHMNINRMRRLLVNETDSKNIPEHMKSLAREMVGMVLKSDQLYDRKITAIKQKDRADALRMIQAWDERDGKFTLNDLQQIPDEEVQEIIENALADIEEGIESYNAPAGRNLIENLNNYKKALVQIQDAVEKITNIIEAEQTAVIDGQKRKVSHLAYGVVADLDKSKRKGEWTGFGSKALTAAQRSVIYGNTTPVYFIKNLRNRGMDVLWQGFESAENRKGLLAEAARKHMQGLAEKYHYASWQHDKNIDVILNGVKVPMKLENIMALYATWTREQQMGPEVSQHMAQGGVYIEDEQENKGAPRREKKTQRARRVKAEDIERIENLLTQEQKDYIRDVVAYLSDDMSKLGNEASMAMYGIKKYNEKYYFPMKVWDGVKSARSDKGISGTQENRIAHKGWDKRRKHKARNALIIGKFTDTAVQHIDEMTNYVTFAPVIEGLNKVLNWQEEQLDEEEVVNRRNLRVMFQEAYGKEALRYLEDWMKDLQGGVTQDQRKTLRDRLISMFKKNAVAGSLSVTLQQPLSYIRAAMLINPKYLAGALSPQYWKGSYQEMMDHSGVAVIKKMGRFDMNFGQSTRDWITPKTGKTVYERFSDALTKAPEIADTMTWTRMWSAVKMEQHAQHPDMDMKSDDFLDLVGKRFNEVMRRTQVYDSTLTKSSNMRSQALSMKLITSFMAEPTLTLNVLADAVMNVKQKGGKATLAKAGATYLLSAVLQAAVKGFMGAGRSPDEKKTAEENLLNKILYNLMSEAIPTSLIPGYSDLVEVLKNGELKDDALGVLGKLKSIYTTAQNMLNPDKSKGPWRDVEDTLGQFVQLFSNIPLKNLMRDTRAMYNWATGSKFAQRDTSGAVLKYQAEETLNNGDNLLGVINSWLGDAGYKSNNKAYYSRMYNAMSGGNEAEAEGIREYLELAKGQGKDKIESGLRTAAREDDSKTPAEQSQWMIDNDLLDGTSSITTQYKKGEITREDAEKLYKAADPKMKDNDVFWKLDQLDYQKETGETETGYYYRLRDAITKNKAEEIKTAVKTLLEHGITKEKIKDKLSDWKAEYIAGDSAKKVQIRDAITKAYKAAGYTADDANKTIERWNNDAKKTEPEKKDKNDTTGRWGRGNIDLNNRKVVENDDGTISTERSFSVNIDGKEVLLPTVIDGKIVSEEEAIHHYEQTGQYLGKFNTVKEAEEYAEKLHNRQDWYYNQ